MVNISFYLLDVNSRIKDGRSYIYLYGRTKEGQKIAVVEQFDSYFYVEGKGDLSALRKELDSFSVEHQQKKIEILRTEIEQKNKLNQKVKFIKVFVSNPEDRHLLKKGLEEKKLNCFEFDIPYFFQYLKDRDLIPFTLIQAEGEYLKEKSKVPLLLVSKVVTEDSENVIEPRILSFDIETYNKERAIIPEKNPILMVSFYSEVEEKPFQKVITWKRFKTNLKYIDFVDGEDKLIRKFKEVIDNYDPDIITGYFSDVFDLPYLKKRAELYKIDLDLGWDYSELLVSKKEDAISRFTGLIHLDVFKFVRNVIGKNMKTESFSLDAVSNELLGYKKYDINIANLAEAWDSQPEELEEFCKYNLQDSYLNYELAVKLMPNLQELVKIIGWPIFELSRMSFSKLVEGYILKRSSEFNLLISNKPTYKEVEWRKKQTYQGAFVYEPQPGLYENILVFDFRSLYPTIIASHNIGPDTLNCHCCSGKEKVPGKKVWFCQKRKSFFSRILEDLISRRARIKEMIKAKKQKKEDIALLEARSYGLKTIANSFYGYMGFFAARWYCLDCVDSITAYARDYITRTMVQAEESGFKVVYGDTDSLMIKLGNKTKKDALAFLDNINSSLPEFMELEMEGFYPRAIFVSLKSGSSGAKKKYALFDGEKIKVVGFESVRRNWSELAKETQEAVLTFILKDNDVDKAINYIHKVVSKLKEGKVKLDKLVLKTQLTRPIDSYESIGPHVVVARKMLEKGYEVFPGMVIHFIVSNGKGLVRERAKMVEEVKEGDYDADYYINNQILPAVSSILTVLGYNEQDLFKDKEQTGLGKYF